MKKDVMVSGRVALALPPYLKSRGMRYVAQVLEHVHTFHRSSPEWRYLFGILGLSLRPWDGQEPSARVPLVALYPDGSIFVSEGYWEESETHLCGKLIAKKTVAEVVRSKEELKRYAVELLQLHFDSRAIPSRKGAYFRGWLLSKLILSLFFHLSYIALALLIALRFYYGDVHFASGGVYWIYVTLVVVLCGLSYVGLVLLRRAMKKAISQFTLRRVLRNWDTGTGMDEGVRDRLQLRHFVQETASQDWWGSLIHFGFLSLAFPALLLVDPHYAILYGMSWFLVGGLVLLADLTLRPKLRRVVFALAFRDMSRNWLLDSLYTLFVHGGRFFYEQKLQKIENKASAAYAPLERVRPWFSFFSFAVFFVFLLGISLGIYWDVRMGTLSWGGFAALSLLFGGLLVFSVRFVMTSFSAILGRVALEFFSNLPSEEVQKVVSSVTEKPDISCQDAVVMCNSFTLGPLKLDVRTGEKVAILGRVGSGKSVFLKALAGLHSLKEGDITVGETSVTQLARTRYELISYLGDQTLSWLPGSVEENVCMGLGKTNSTAIESWAQVMGLRHVLRESMQNLTHGQKQAVALMRVLLEERPILLLDEPTRFMDWLMERDIVEAIHKRMSSVTIVLATQKVSMLHLVDRVLVLERGTVVLDAPRTEVLENLEHINV